MDNEYLEFLIRQPEGLKLDFKRQFYKIDAESPEGRKRQWGELIKDILSLANGNINIARETGYLIFGVGDEILSDGTRMLYGIGDIEITRQQILDKVNTVTNPPLSDVQCQLLRFFWNSWG